VKRDSHDEAVRTAITVGRIYRDKQFVYRGQNRWVSISVKGRDAIRQLEWRWPR
jgi:hypothetical protein